MQVGSLLEVRSLSARPEHRTEISIWVDGDEDPPGWELLKFISDPRLKLLLKEYVCLFKGLPYHRYAASSDAEIVTARHTVD